VIRVVVADDHDVVRQGFRRIIEAQPDQEMVGEAADGAGLLDLLGSVRADVLLLDISMPGPGFLSLMDALGAGFPGVPVLVVSMHAEELWAIQALKAGAAGYLTKTRSAEELADAVRRVHAGGRYITASLAERLALLLGPRGGPKLHDALSRREFETLRRLGSGKMVKTVAREMGLSPKTVTTFRKRILEKLDLRSTADLVRYALDHDLVE